MGRKPTGYWTVMKLREEALKYKTKKEFINLNRSAYSITCKLGFLDDVCSHMKPQRNFWTEGRVHEEALKYNTRQEFRLGDVNAYAAARRLKILDDVCSHMIPMGHMFRRAIYTIKFPKIKKFYTGLTYNYENRISQHTDRKNKKRNKELARLIDGGEPYEIDYKNEWYDIEIIILKEQEGIDEMVNFGWTPINIAKVGSLGGNYRKWTEEKIRKEALKHKTKFDFQKNSKGAYGAARTLGILDDVCSHMEELRRGWTEEEVREEALKYKTRNEFRKSSRKAYDASCPRSLDILDDVCSHMEPIFIFWSKETVMGEALKYKNRLEFAKGSGGAYKWAQTRKLLGGVCSHMPKPIHWTEEKIREEALKYKTRNEFRLDSSAYQAAQRIGILNDVCSHMKELLHKWTEEEIIKESVKYKSRNEFRLGNSAYQAAQKLGILDKICPHLK